MTTEEYAELLDRLNEQDRRITMLENYAMEDHENIRKALDSLQRVLAPKVEK